MGEVVSLGERETVGDGIVLDCDTLLENAKGKFVQMIIIGFEHDGEIHINSSHGSREALWLIKRGEHHLLFETE